MKVNANDKEKKAKEKKTSFMVLRKSFHIYPYTNMYSTQDAIFVQEDEQQKKMDLFFIYKHE